MYVKSDLDTFKPVEEKTEDDFIYNKAIAFILENFEMVAVHGHEKASKMRERFSFLAQVTSQNLLALSKRGMSRADLILSLILSNDGHEHKTHIVQNSVFGWFREIILGAELVDATNDEELKAIASKYAVQAANSGLVEAQLTLASNYGENTTTRKLISGTLTTCSNASFG